VGAQRARFAESPP
jgi:2-polyprenyl-3-methyl-5-hydroxy-6-metoxy-1,4-benzoquinol methylase